MAILSEAQIKSAIDAQYTTNGSGNIQGVNLNGISTDMNESYFNSIDINAIAIALNTAKTGITAQQTSDISTNNAKTGITAQQITDISTNNAKTGITAQQTADIVTNLAKVGITTQQGLDIITNLAKISADGSVETHNDVSDAGSGIIMSDAERTKLGSLLNAFLGYFADDTALIAAHTTATTINYALVGSTNTFWSWNGSAWANTGNTSTADMLISVYDSQAVGGDAFLFSNMTGTVLKTQLESAVQTELNDNTAKVGITPTQASEIVTNNAKVGITAQESSDITTNNAKVGITAQESSDITTNNAKTGITAQESSDITTNNAKVGITAQESSDITTNNAKIGISAQQTADILVNNSKVVITPTQASDITANKLKVDTIVAGTNVTVDATDPLNPIVSSTGGGGGGDLLSTNNLSDLDNNATSRTNLDVYSKAESDGSALFDIVDTTLVPKAGRTLNADVISGFSGDQFTASGDDTTGDVDRASPNDVISANLVYDTNHWYLTGSAFTIYVPNNHISSDDDTLITANDWIFCAEIKVDVSAPTGIVMGNYTTGGNGIQMMYTANSVLVSSVIGGANNSNVTVAVTKGVWQKIVVVYDSAGAGTQNVFVEGVGGTATAVASMPAPAKFRFGANIASGTQGFSGEVRNATIYNSGTLTNTPNDWIPTSPSSLTGVNAVMYSADGSGKDSAPTLVKPFVDTSGSPVTTNSYPTTNNFIPYEILPSPSTQVQSASLRVYDSGGALATDSGYNVMWSVDGGVDGYPSGALTPSAFRALGLLTTSTNYRIAIQPIGSQTVANIEIWENETQLSVTVGGGIRQTVNGERKFELNIDGQMMLDDSTTPDTPVDGVTLYSENEVLKYKTASGVVKVITAT